MIFPTEYSTISKEREVLLMKKLPIGRDNLKDILEGYFYYVDKTKIIEELLDRGENIQKYAIAFQGKSCKVV